MKNWAEQDRPREKMMRHGPMNLTDSELIAILLRQGTHSKTALDLAKEILGLSKNNLKEFSQLQPADFMKLKGVGRTKSVVLAAALELGRRCQTAAGLARETIRNSQDLADFLRPMLQDLTHEVFLIAFLNNANRIRHYEVISSGGLTATVADPRIIMKKALEENAVSLVLCHNHPSGNLLPSRSDQELTLKIRDAARLFDIRVLDHLIVSQEGHYSFADEGLL